MSPNEPTPRHSVAGTLVVVSGVGTEIGKTHACEALLRACPEGVQTLGYKPVETGVVPGHPGADAERLRLASTFHVKHPVVTFTYEKPISPHLAARETGRPIDLAAVRDQAHHLVRLAELVIVELPGGLFSPLNDHETNADLARLLGGRLVLVAPDRLGVLHDVRAATLAAATRGLQLGEVILVAPGTPDASTTINRAELERTGTSVLVSLPRAPADDLARRLDLRAVVERWVMEARGLAPT